MGSNSMEMEDEHHHIISSSEDEDGDEQWKAAIKASASAFLGCPQPNQTLTHASDDDDDDNTRRIQPQPIKHYQIKAQKALDDILQKTLDMVKSSDPIDNVDDHPVINEGGVRLFKQAPIGIVFDHKDRYEGPKKKPRILPGEEIYEKSKKFKRRLQSVVVEGIDILTTAKETCQKSLSKLEAKEIAAKEAAKREEERVAQLKKIRGERWLPSIAREMQVKSVVR